MANTIADKKIENFTSEDLGIYMIHRQKASKSRQSGQIGNAVFHERAAKRIAELYVPAALVEECDALVANTPTLTDWAKVHLRWRELQNI